MQEFCRFRKRNGVNQEGCPYFAQKRVGPGSNFLYSEMMAQPLFSQ
jgi:hypothetical protein